VGGWKWNIRSQVLKSRVKTRLYSMDAVQRLNGSGFLWLAYKKKPVKKDLRYSLPTPKWGLGRDEWPLIRPGGPQRVYRFSDKLE